LFEYAIALFQDENSDDKMNTNFMGKPNKLSGFSINASGNFDPPDFKDAAFMLVKNKPKSLTIHLKKQTVLNIELMFNIRILFLYLFFLSFSSNAVKSQNNTELYVQQIEDLIVKQAFFKPFELNINKDVLIKLFNTESYYYPLTCFFAPFCSIL